MGGRHRVLRAGVAGRSPLIAPRQFRSTRWSLVLQAGQGDGESGRAALNELCGSYWYPLYAYVRRRGFGEEEARDLTQGFFARLIEKGVVAAADPARGRFRAFLLRALQDYVSNEQDRQRAWKRGGHCQTFSMDFEDAGARYAREPAHADTPEAAFTRQWALEMVDRAMTRLREEWAGRGRSATFARLQATVGGDAADHVAAAADLGMTPGAVKVTVHRLRARYRELLRAEILATVQDPDEVNEELGELFESLQSPREKSRR